MRIGRPRVEERGASAALVHDIDWAGGRDTLWYSVPKAFGDLFSTRADAALVALLIPAMAEGEAIEIDGTVSPRLHYNAAVALQGVLQDVVPRLHVVEVRPNDVAPAAGMAAGVATGFSGGVDSFCVVADHYLDPQPGAYRLTHLLFHDVGSHEHYVGDETPAGASLFRTRFERLVPAAEEMGLPFIPVASNLARFYRKHGFQLTHTPRNASVALALQAGLGCYMYAASYGYRDIHLGPSLDTANSDLVTLPMMSTEAMDMFSVGTEQPRLQKALRLDRIELARKYLDVCVEFTDRTNCSVCWKCMRLLLALEIAGKLEPFADIFDLDAYRRERDDFIATMLHSDVAFEVDIRALAEERGFRWPLRSRMIAAAGELPGAWRVQRQLSRWLPRPRRPY